MKKEIRKTEIYEFTLSELLKALELKITKGKQVNFNESFDLDKSEPLLHIIVK